MVLGEEDAVDVVVAGVLCLGADSLCCLGHAVCAVICSLDELASLDQVELHECCDTQRAHGSSSAAEQICPLSGRSLHDFAISQHHLDIIDRLVEESMAERAALARRARKAASGRDARKLHHHGRHQAMAQRRLDQAVHGNIGLDEGRPRASINGQDVAEGADVDGAVAGAGARPRAVCRAVEDAVGLAALEVAADGGGDFGDGLLVALHGGGRPIGLVGRLGMEMEEVGVEEVGFLWC